MADEQATIGINRFTGFGWCAETQVVTDADGTQTMTFRYLPPGLWCSNLDRIPNLVNEAARVFSTFDEFPSDLIPNETANEIEALTERGRRFYESCPLYATLEVKEPWFTWAQYQPNGKLAWKSRTNTPDFLLGEVVRLWPMDEWGHKFLAPWAKYLDHHPKLGHVGMYMQLPLDNARREVDSEGWEEGLEVPRAAVVERVEYPLGLYRVLLVSCDVSHEAHCKKMEANESFCLLPCALAYRGAPEEPFTWKEHFVFRFAACVQFLPRAIKWTLENELAHSGAWSCASIRPFYRWNDPVATFQLAGEPPWVTTAIYLEPLESLTHEKRAVYEDELNRLKPSALGT